MSKGFRTPRAAVALVTATAVFLSPVAPLLRAQTAAPKPAPAQAPAAKPATPAQTSTAKPAAACAADSARRSRWRLAEGLRHAERRPAAGLSAADRQLGRSEADGRVRRCILHAEGGAETEPRDAQVRSGHVGRSERTSRELQQASELTETNFANLPKEQLQEIVIPGRRSRRSAERDDHRARPRACAASTRVRSFRRTSMA